MASSQLQEISTDDLFDALQIRLRNINLISSTSIQQFTSRITALQNEAHKAITVDLNVRGLLNDLTKEQFDLISDQMITWANKAETERDGRTLDQITHLVFEKAIDDVASSELYARLCRKMMEGISAKVQDHRIKNKFDKPFTGQQLFRKYLLNLCQEKFERRTTATGPAADMGGGVQSNEGNTGGSNQEYALYSYEYYAAMPKAKRSWLGTVRFIGELFKVQMLTERIIHECVKILLSDSDPSTCHLGDEKIEGVYMLLTTIGSMIDTPRARAFVDVYFQRIKFYLTESPHYNNGASHIRYMLIDLIDLRGRKWLRRSKDTHISITVAREAVDKEKGSREKECHQQRMSMSWDGDGRDDEDYAEVGPDGWASGRIDGSGSSIPYPPLKAGDLSNGSQVDVISTWQRLFQVRKGTKTTIQQHAIDIRDIATQLTSLGEKPSDNLLIAVFVLSLPHSYSNFVESFQLERSTGKKSHIDFDSVVQCCIDEEARQL